MCEINFKKKRSGILAGALKTVRRNLSTSTERSLQIFSIHSCDIDKEHKCIHMFLGLKPIVYSKTNFMEIVFELCFVQIKTSHIFVKVVVNKKYKQ